MAMNETFFKNCCSNVEKQVNERLADHNTLKSNVTNPHSRSLTLCNIPRLAFAYRYGCSFLQEERHGVGNEIVSPICTILNIYRLTSFFPASVIVKVLSSGDTTLITPWISLTCDLLVKVSQNKRTTFEAGKLGIPLKEDGKNTLVYFVCGRLNEHDNVPDWATELSPKDLNIPTASGTYHETKGIGIISLEKKK